MAALIAVASVTSIGCSRSPRPRPSGSQALSGTILILVDTLRADHLGSYGSDFRLTPVIDELASRGTLFENAVAPSSWTRSSVASLFTSRFPSAIRVHGREDVIGPGVVTLAEVFRDAGFDTLAVSTNANAGADFGFAQGFDRFEEPNLVARYPDDFYERTAEGVTKMALRFLDDRVGGRPFFLFLHYVDPHDPYLPHPEYSELGPEPAGRFDGSRRDLSALDALSGSGVTEEDRARIRHLYRGEVRFCDFWIGELLRGLEDRRLRDRVQVAVTSDHGEGLWDHGERAHGRDLYEEQVHVPLILDAPSSIDGDQPVRVSAPVSLVDIAPTLLTAHGIEPPSDFRGTDLSTLAQGKRRSRELEYIYTELDLDGRNFEALRHGARKLIRDRRPVSEGGLELYDLGSDPGEKQNLAPSRPPQLAQLERALAGVARKLLEQAEEAQRIDLADLGDETLESLKALGYLSANDVRARRTARPGLAPVLDFSQAHSGDQLSGFYEPENGRRWMSGRAAAILGSDGTPTRWRVKGWIDLALHARDELTVTIRAGGSEPQRRTIDRSGFFALEGPLPEDVGTAVRLEFECDHEFVPARQGGDKRRLCAIVQSISVF